MLTHYFTVSGYLQTQGGAATLGFMEIILQSQSLGIHLEPAFVNQRA